MNCHLMSDSNRIIPSSSGYGRPTFQSIECYCNSCMGRLSSNWCFWNKDVLFSARITNEVSSSGTDLRSVHSVNPFSFGTNSLFILATVGDKPMKNKSSNMIQHNGFYCSDLLLHLLRLRLRLAIESTSDLLGERIQSTFSLVERIRSTLETSRDLDRASSTVGSGERQHWLCLSDWETQELLSVARRRDPSWIRSCGSRITSSARSRRTTGDSTIDGSSSESMEDNRLRCTYSSSSFTIRTSRTADRQRTETCRRRIERRIETLRRTTTTRRLCGDSSSTQRTFPMESFPANHRHTLQTITSHPRWSSLQRHRPTLARTDRSANEEIERILDPDAKQHRSDEEKTSDHSKAMARIRREVRRSIDEWETRETREMNLDSIWWKVGWMPLNDRWRRLNRLKSPSNNTKPLSIFSKFVNLFTLTHLLCCLERCSPDRQDRSRCEESVDTLGPFDRRRSDRRSSSVSATSRNASLSLQTSSRLDQRNFSTMFIDHRREDSPREKFAAEEHLRTVGQCSVELRGPVRCSNSSAGSNETVGHLAKIRRTSARSSRSRQRIASSTIGA